MAALKINHLAGMYASPIAWIWASLAEVSTLDPDDYHIVVAPDNTGMDKAYGEIWESGRYGACEDGFHGVCWLRFWWRASAIPRAHQSRAKKWQVDEQAAYIIFI